MVTSGGCLVIETIADQATTVLSLCAVHVTVFEQIVQTFFNTLA